MHQLPQREHQSQSNAHHKLIIQAQSEFRCPSQEALHLNTPINLRVEKETVLIEQNCDPLNNVQEHVVLRTICAHNGLMNCCR